MYQQGNTVRLQGTFYDWDGNLIDPDLVKVIIYDVQYRQLNEYPLDASNRKSVGQYYLDWITDTVGSFTYEMYAEISGTPSLQRQRINVVRV